MELAAKLARDRARVVVVGDVGMHVPRAPFYEKELDLRLSRSYGPGRYDAEYEERGLDYPIGYVRWTERRNMSAFVDLVATGKVDVSSLITDRVDLDDAAEAYGRLAESETSPLAIILRYPEQSCQRRRRSRAAAGGSGFSLVRRRQVGGRHRRGKLRRTDTRPGAPVRGVLDHRGGERIRPFRRPPRVPLAVEAAHTAGSARGAQPWT